MKIQEPIVTENINPKWNKVNHFGSEHPPFECNNRYCKHCGLGNKKPSEVRRLDDIEHERIMNIVKEVSET